ncbi:sigma-54 dependent transcriptional regulator [Fulvivirgaceae bacterium BMA10]|uniref:Sigma-54 dependent transcriptional regulator n=1 Tax=Splendidivirga corallicola TaxID=3051826 RepID=A0ABT8KRP4_9BACT|nr:sigma-54 dependent transcriptional regulator [Fulvivirgaceae bacterium BMA10]
MVLIIDDDEAVRTSLSLQLKQAGYLTVSVGEPSEALRVVYAHRLEIILMDMNYSKDTSGEEGLRLLKQIKNITPSTPVILITGWGSIPLAVEGMKAGAADFINKPWDYKYLLQSVRTAIRLSKQVYEKQSVSISRKKLDQQYDFSQIIGEDQDFLKVLKTIGTVSKTNASILIQGESGTGKELIAEAVHKNSQRSNQPFVKVNLGGIPTALFESEMFGHKKGAFTDARNDRTGRFELANRGTIFLDEIGDLDLSCQVKMLRVLQDRTFEVLGESQKRTVDVRVISATNRNLQRMVEKIEFREDLFYRINLITVRIPPLRERPGDIPLLVDYFINNFKKIYKRPHLIIDKSTMGWLKELPLPGNVRELKNLVERTVLVTERDSLGVEDFSAQLQSITRKKGKDGLPSVGAMTLEEMEISMIQKALEFYDNNVSKAAVALGLSRGAFYRRMEKYNIPDEA